MSTNPNLPAGAFITSINGKRCTAVPKEGVNVAALTAQTFATTTTTAAIQAQQTVANPIAAADEGVSTTSTTSSAPPPPPPSPPAPAVEFFPLAAQEAPQPPPPALTASGEIPAQTQIAQFTQAQAAPPPAEVAAEAATVAAAAATTKAIPTFQLAAAPAPSPSSPPSQAQAPAPSPQEPQPSAAESSVTDNNTVPTFGQASATPSPLAQSEVTDLPSLAAAPTESAALVTTIGFDPGSPAGDAAAATGATDNGPAISLVPQQPQAQAGTPTIIIAGSVIGGVALVSIIGFLLWYWRKRVIKKRRSTLLTPLSTDPRTFGGAGAISSSGEKGNFTIDRGSLGPTPRSEKMRAALGYNFKRLRGNLSVAFSRGSNGTPSVNMNRGTSQFMDGGAIPQHNRNDSGLSGGAVSKASIRSDVTTKDRFMDWWGRLTADARFNWRVRNERGGDGADPFAAARDMKERKAALSTQPDFLTLLSMDDREVEREQRRRLSKNRPGSAGSNNATTRPPPSRSGPSPTPPFLGGLGLNFDRDDPFSDINAIRPHDSAKVAPLQVSKSDNPFSDANAITAPLATASKGGPANYVANVRRSRGQSTGGGAGGSGNRPPSNSGTTYRLDSIYNRESVNSVDSFQARRNKFRSDPFDLDRPELLSSSGGSSRQKVTSSNVSTAGDSTAPRLSSNTSGSGGNANANNGLGERNLRRTRADSFTSKYSSGISMGDWSDPGPDVGPAASRWDSPTEGWRAGEQSPRRTSGGSQTSVGKAL